MIVEERNYLVKPGQAKRYLELWNEHGRDVQTKVLGDLVGVFTAETGDLNTIVYIWRFSSFEERERRRAALMQNEQFAEFRKLVRDLMVSQKNRLLKQHGCDSGECNGSRL